MAGGGRGRKAGHSIWASFSVSILHLGFGLGCPAASLQAPHPPCGLKVPLAHTSNSRRPCSALAVCSFPRLSPPPPGGSLQIRRLLPWNRGCPALWPVGCSCFQARAMFRSSGLPPNGLAPFLPQPPGGIDLPGRCKVPLSPPSGRPGIPVPSAGLWFCARPRHSSRYTVPTWPLAAFHTQGGSSSFAVVFLARHQDWHDRRGIGTREAGPRVVAHACEWERGHTGVREQEALIAGCREPCGSACGGDGRTSVMIRQCF